MPFLADIPNDAAFFKSATDYLGWLVAFVVGVLALLNSLKRKPSVDVDFQKHDGRLTLVEAEVKQARTELRLLFNHHRETAQMLTSLREGQSANTANITDIKTTVHELKDDSARDDMQRAAQLSAITARIDQLISQGARK